MPKGNQGTKHSNKEDSSGSQNSKASRHTACSVYAQIFPAGQEHYVEARAAAENAKSGLMALNHHVRDAKDWATNAVTW